MLSKRKLRKKYALLRKKRYFSVKKDFYKPLNKIINFKKKKKISLYYPSNYEVDTFYLFKMLKEKYRASISLPKILSSGRMKFVPWNFFNPLKVNKYGFLEPSNDSKMVFPEIIFVPLLAFDKFHNRLGYGKGFYDKFLSKYKENKKKLITIGVAFSFQKYKKIPTTKSDMKLDYILTEKGIF